MIESKPCRCCEKQRIMRYFPRNDESADGRGDTCNFCLAEAGRAARLQRLKGAAVSHAAGMEALRAFLAAPAVGVRT